MISTAPADLTLMNSYMSMAVLQWERDSQWTPFLAGNAEERTFDAPDGKTLFPNVGILSVARLRIDDDDMTANQDYFLQHKVPNGPYMAVEFAQSLKPYLRALRIQGVFGFQTELGKDVELALLDRGAEIYRSATSGEGGEVSEVRQGPVTIKYAASSSGGSSSGFGSFYSTVLEMYRRKV